MSCVALASPAVALNVPVAGRVIAFTQPPPAGAVQAAIIYQPGNAASEAEADQIERQIGNGLVVGRSIIRASRIAATDTGSLSGKRLAFITTGVQNQAEIAEMARRGSVLTITADLNCVQGGRCMVAVTGPHSQITVNTAAVAAARIRLGSAFLMLIKEI